jgi:hypothetical protein
VTFKDPAEAITLIQNLSVQQLLFKLMKDQGIYASKNKKMTLPYIVSSNGSNNQVGRTLIPKLFDLK